MSTKTNTIELSIQKIRKSHFHNIKSYTEDPLTVLQNVKPNSSRYQTFIEGEIISTPIGEIVATRIVLQGLSKRFGKYADSLKAHTILLDMSNIPMSDRDVRLLMVADPESNQVEFEILKKYDDYDVLFNKIKEKISKYHVDFDDLEYNVEFNAEFPYLSMNSSKSKTNPNLVINCRILRYI